jgi:hypothetical protein
MHMHKYVLASTQFNISLKLKKKKQSLQYAVVARINSTQLPFAPFQSQKQMENLGLRKNTIRIDFPEGSSTPTDREIIKFLTELRLQCEHVHTVYYDTFEKCIFLKFHLEEKLKSLIDQHWECFFKYDCGEVRKVRLIEVHGNFKYVRIFNLPPEIEDRDVAASFDFYGKVHKVVREKFPDTVEFSVYSGIRGVYMEMKTEIPSHMLIKNNNVKVQYYGLKNMPVPVQVQRVTPNLNNLATLLKCNTKLKPILKPCISQHSVTKHSVKRRGFPVLPQVPQSQEVLTATGSTNLNNNTTNSRRVHVLPQLPHEISITTASTNSRPQLRTPSNRLHSLPQVPQPRENEISTTASTMNNFNQQQTPISFSTSALR